MADKSGEIVLKALRIVDDQMRFRQNQIEAEYSIGPGSLRVPVAGEEVFSRHKTDRMPASTELINLLRQKTQQA